MTMIFLCGKGDAAEDVFNQLIGRSSVKLAVFTHPGERLHRLAEDLRIYRSTESINDIGAWPFVPQLIISIGYLTIISAQVLALAPGINCHYSLLPRHRGRSPVPWAILSGDTMTGITWHWMESTVDTGRIILQAAAQIGPKTTAASLFDDLHDLAADTWTQVLTIALSGFRGWEQRGAASRHPAGPPLGGKLGILDHGERVDRMIRAMTYPPLPPATLGGYPVRSLADFYEISSRLITNGEG